MDSTINPQELRDNGAARYGQPPYQQESFQERRGPLTPEELNIRGPGGIGFSFRGQSQQLLIVLLIMMCFGVAGYFMYQHGVDSAAAVKSQTEATARIEKHLESQDQTMEAMIYVLSLPEKEREKLNLSKPRKLLDMQR